MLYMAIVQTPCWTVSKSLQEICILAALKSVGVLRGLLTYAGMIESLLLHNMPWIKGIARTFCRNNADAEDLVGETILKVLLNAERFDVGKSFRLWVLVIMRNTYLSRRRHVGIVEPFSNLPDCKFDCDPAKNTILKEDMRIIDGLSEKSVGVRCAILYAQGYSYMEIADMQGVSVNIVKSRIHHGRMLIKRRVQG